MISAEEFLRAHPVGPEADAAAPAESRGGGRARLPMRSRSSWSVRGVDDPMDVDACREAALRLLDAAPRSSGTLRERLTDRGYDADVVEAVILRLAQVRLIDDEAYARSAVRYCAARLMGGRGAAAELARRGVDRGMAQRIVTQAESEGVFEEAAWELGRRYAAKTEGMDPERRRRRFWAAGGRKGHAPDVLRRVAQELF
ncbi:RecX family transcriptional regulator [Bifidobacterium amazonense]|uniref:Regulatory protein RecX n=1 Tax=Bifidobacterium amazonense TaxID=2809027 RepID=A0ABS9VXM4_9BIFI|nr:regulatory protein RecX [Bifidobacterium amazonense]MCH9276869.1 RecX family transcriptional regulator [Bifidobacterium amazonense]